MNIFLLDIAANRTQLLPLTYFRSIAELRIGILKIYEKWELRLSGRASFITEDYLGRKNVLNGSESNLIINSSVCPDENLITAISRLNVGQKLIKDGNLIAVKTDTIPRFGDSFDLNFSNIDYAKEIILILKPQDIFTRNGEQIRKDFELITNGRNSSAIYDPHSIIYNKKDVFLEEGAEIKACILNAENGPIYLGKNAMVSEGAIIKGPFALGEYGHISIGAKIRGDSTFGPYTKVGGEVSNSVIMGYSNKGHEGYMGNSVIGEWCNLGADTNTSNMKNNYSNVKIWDYSQDAFRDSGLQFCGLIMGDHSKCGINTMFNTGTIAGVSTNIFGAGYPRNFIPSFSWGGSSGFETYQLQRAIQTASIAMQRKGKQLSNIDIGIFEHVFEQSSKYRTW